MMDTARRRGVDFNALGGADTVAVNDLTGTDVTQRQRRPRPQRRAGDGAADRVIVNGTAGADAIAAAGGTARSQVTGLAARSTSRTPRRPTTR